MVGEEGLEPTRSYDQRILSSLRLPITPLAQNNQRTKFKISGNKEDRIRTYSVIKCAPLTTTCLRLGPPNVRTSLLPLNINNSPKTNNCFLFMF